MQRPDEPSTTAFRMFAHSRGIGSLDHVFPARRQVEMCGDHSIVEVSVRVTDGEWTHWGWLDTGKDQPTMIWPTYRQLCVCFQGEAGMLDRVERGFGRPVQLLVEECANAKV